MPVSQVSYQSTFHLMAVIFSSYLIEQLRFDKQKVFAEMDWHTSTVSHSACCALETQAPEYCIVLPFPTWQLWSY